MKHALRSTFFLSLLAIAFGSAPASRATPSAMHGLALSIPPVCLPNLPPDSCIPPDGPTGGGGTGGGGGWLKPTTSPKLAFDLPPYCPTPGLPCIPPPSPCSGCGAGPLGGGGWLKPAALYAARNLLTPLGSSPRDQAVTQFVKDLQTGKI